MDNILRHCRRYFIYAGVFSLFINLLMLTLPLYMLQMFDRVLTSRSGETLLMLTLAAVFALILHGTLDNLRSRILLGASIALDGMTGPPVLNGLLSETVKPGNRNVIAGLRDVAILRGFLSGPGIISLFDAPWAPIFLVIIYIFHPLLGAMATVGAITLFLLAYVNEKVTRGPHEKNLLASRKAGRYIDAGIRNAEVVNALGMRDDLTTRWQRLNNSVIDTQVTAGLRGGVLSSTSRFVRMAVQILMLATGASLVIDQQVTPGIMMAGTLILARALAPVEHAITTWRGLVDARSAYKRLKQLLRQEQSQEAGVSLPTPSGRLELEGVSFHVPGSDRLIINNVSFRLEPGESLGLIGPSAAGKSTLARLITGIWRPSAGAVRLDGADVSTWPRASIGPHIGYLPQDVELFEGSVGENICRLGKESEEEESIIDAAKRAHTHGMITRLPEAYDTRIGETGMELSTGQRQRIGLARAMFGDPRLVILDEPNANLDGEGEEALLKCLRDLKSNGITTITISHKPSLLSGVDKLLVLKDGKVEMFGSRDEVMANVTRNAQAMRTSDNPIVSMADRKP